MEVEQYQVFLLRDLDIVLLENLLLFLILMMKLRMMLMVQECLIDIFRKVVIMLNLNI